MTLVFTLIFILVVCIGVYYLFFSPSSQVFGKVNYHFKPNGKQIALTFDDGPNEPYTSRLLDILKKHDIKATFFVCGACVKRHPETFKRICVEGHEVGNHSHDHSFSHYFNPRSYNTEVLSTSLLIKQLTGKNVQLYRSPWLFRTANLLNTVRSAGLTPVWGTFGSELEVFQPPAKTMVKRAIKLCKPGRIIIFHDGKESIGGDRTNTVTAIELLVPDLIEKGYEFVLLTPDTFK